MSECRLLFFGDIVGRPGRVFLKEQLPVLCDFYKPDLVFANGENAAGGFGLNASVATELKTLGIHGITLGNHTWDQRCFWSEIQSLDYVCRPVNLPQECPGNRYLIFECKGYKIALFNLIGRAFSNLALDCPFKTAEAMISQLKSEGIENFVVDIHAEATAEKYALGWFLSDLGVSCVVGTHTHVQTADERILNKKTAFICDLGMCGAYNSILGFRVDTIIEKSKCGKPCRFEVASGLSIINGVFVRLDLETKQAISIERIFKIESAEI